MLDEILSQCSKQFLILKLFKKKCYDTDLGHVKVVHRTEVAGLKLSYDEVACLLDMITCKPPVTTTEFYK